MPLLYQMLTGWLALPFILCLGAHRKYRKRLLRRLGWGLRQELGQSLHSAARQTIWIHALSVGEVTSALPLVYELRKAYPRSRLVFSVTTRSGADLAQQRLFPHIDALIAAPLDIGPVVPWFLRAIRPDLFILVETDFWPHWLHCLARQGVPSLLVNGRIAAASLKRYQGLPALFRPMFDSFTLLSMQTKVDAANMIRLGVDVSRVVHLGNLKFDTNQGHPHKTDLATRAANRATNRARYGFSDLAPLWICGSTHAGEEAIIFQAHAALRGQVPGLQLLLAPRNIERGQEILALADRFGISCRLWSCDKVGKASKGSGSQVLILNTIGELADCYAMADAVFVGGSLVAKGGHNPLEPAAVQVPVIFGPQMEDFSEIAAALVAAGGAFQVDAQDELLERLQQMLSQADLRQSMASAGWRFVQENQGVVRQHLLVIEELLTASKTYRSSNE